MSALDQICLPRDGATPRPLTGLEQTHGVNTRAARMYTRFFGQQEVLLDPKPHNDMLLSVLEDLVARKPVLADMDGVAVYAKTQTHNTPSDQNWLRQIFDAAGLARWETSTFSMTNCASGLAAVHAFAEQDRPYLVLTGEKAFHPSGSRLSVGLLGEAATAALFMPGAKRNVRKSWVKHVPRYFMNPDDMAADDKASLQSEFETGFESFLQTCIESEPAFFARNPVLVPYNLNKPLLARVLTRLQLDHLVPPAFDARFGHTFCSDAFLNLALHEVPPQTPIFLFCAGMGVTYAAVALDSERAPLSPFEITNPETKGKTNVI